MHGAHLHIYDHRIRDADDYHGAVETRESLKDRLKIPGISDFESRDILRRIKAWDHVIEAYVASKKNEDTTSSSAHRSAWALD